MVGCFGERQISVLIDIGYHPVFSGVTASGRFVLKTLASTLARGDNLHICTLEVNTVLLQTQPLLLALRHNSIGALM